MKTKRHVFGKSKRTGERGIALLLCLFALLLLTGIALGLMFMSDTEMSINNNYADSQRAYFAAMAGLQEARVRLMRDPVTGALSPLAPTTMPSALLDTGVTYIVNNRPGEAITFTNAGTKYFDDQLCNEGFATALGISAGTQGIPCGAVPSGAFFKQVNSSDPNFNQASAMDYKWVRITQKGNLSAAPFYVAPTGTTLPTTPICWDGFKQVPKPAGMATCEDEAIGLNYRTVYRLTSFAMAPSGSQRMLQMEVSDTPPFVTNAAVASQDHVTLNGQLTINAYDNCSCDWSKCVAIVTGSGSNKKTTWDCSAASRTGKVCDTTKWAIYSAGTVDSPNTSENLYSGHDPAYAQQQDWPYQIEEMIQTYKDLPTTKDVTKAPYNWTCTGATSTFNGSCGTVSGGIFGVPPILDPPPDPANLVPNTQYGSALSNQVTYVPGNAHLTGAAGNGILIVDGDLTIGGGLEFYGLILVKGVVKFTGGGSAKTNIMGAVLAGEQSLVDLDTVLGGSANIRFDRCALEQKKDPAPPIMLSFHEISY